MNDQNAVTSVLGDGEEWLTSRYESVFMRIRQDIQGGHLAPGTKLAGERKMAESMGVSRETIREALRLCEESGLVIRVPTRGTFVAPPKVDQDLGHMESFTSLVQRMQLKPEYTLVGVDAGTANEEIAGRLRVENGSPVLHVRALGMGSELPLAYYESVLPEHVVSILPPDPDWASRSTYQIVGDSLGAEVLEVDQEFSAVAMPRVISQLLRVTAKTPGFRTVSVFSHGSLPIEMRTSWYPGSRYSFRVGRTVSLKMPVQ